MNEWSITIKLTWRTTETGFYTGIYSRDPRGDSRASSSPRAFGFPRENSVNYFIVVHSFVLLDVNDDAQFKPSL